MDELDPGTILGGKYCVERLFAQGGMSRLYLGHLLHGAGRVAIKELDLPDQGSVTSEDLAQFRKEYDILHGLQHPGLAQPLDFLDEGGRHYLVEEFVPGETLEAHIQAAGKVPVDEAVSIMEQLLRVLEYLHSHQVIYRDLKPQNVILQPRPSEGEEPTGRILPYVVRLVDFGAARRWKRGATADTMALGTPGFAPPEQYGKAQSDARSDVYGAGALLHYMLTGHPPDLAKGWVFEPPHRLVSGIPRDLGQAVLKAVQVAPERRFQDAREMRLALMRAAGRLARCSRCGTELREDGKSCKRCSTRGYLPSLGFLLTIVAGFFLLVEILVPCFPRGMRGQGQLTACKSNLKNLGTALEMYSTDNSGRFPTKLGALIPNYLKIIPTCPSVGSDTYSKGFRSASSPDAYTAICFGSNHARFNQGENYPQYTSTLGLISQ